MTSIFEKLKPDYIRKHAAKGYPVPAEYADVSKARLYYKGDYFGHPEISLMVEHYNDQQLCYSVWLGHHRGVRCAMRNAGEKRPVYLHDLVDKG